MIFDLKTLLLDRFNKNNFNLSSSKINLLVDYMELILEWNKKINITSHHDPNDIVDKDILDTIYLHKYIFMYIYPSTSIIDMGCGAGFIGITLSIIEPTLRVGLLEATKKKVNFLRYALTTLKLKNVEIIPSRAEVYSPQWEEQFTMSVSRATWPINEYMKHAHYYVQNNGIILFMAGRNQNFILNKKNDMDRSKFEIFNYKILPNNYVRKIFLFKR